MKIKDFKRLDLAIEQAFQWGVSNTQEMQNCLQFFVVYEKPCFFKIVVLNEECEEEIHFRSVETLYKLFCRS